MIVEYNGKEFQGETVVDVVVSMRKARYFYWEIGEAFGHSYEWARLLCPKELQGYLEYPELEKEKTFDQSDESIADNLRVPLSRVMAARRRIGNRKPHSVDIGRRQKWLADKLFGAEPNVRFSSFVRELVSIDGLPDAQKIAVVSFYVEGGGDVNDYARIKRFNAVKRLAMVAETMNLEELRQSNVIK